MCDRSFVCGSYFAMGDATADFQLCLRLCGQLLCTCHDFSAFWFKFHACLWLQFSHIKINVNMHAVVMKSVPTCSTVLYFIFVSGIFNLVSFWLSECSE